MVTTLDGHLKFLIVVEAAANTSCNSSLRTGNIQVEVCQAKVIIARNYATDANPNTNMQGYNLKKYTYVSESIRHLFE